PGVTAYDVARGGRRPANGQVTGELKDLQPPASVGDRRRAVDVGPDKIALDRAAVRVRDLDAELGIARDEVARPCGRPAKLNAIHATHVGANVRQGVGARGVGTHLVPLEDQAEGTLDEQAVAAA